MKKIILFLLIITFIAEAQRPRRADEQRSARSPYAQSILWRDLHKSTQDSIRQAVADSLAALSADGVTIVNSSGTFVLNAVSPTGGAYNTIASAIAAASAGDRILVYPGTYTEALTITKNLVLDLSSGAVLQQSSGSNSVLTVGAATVTVIGGELKNTGTATGDVLSITSASADVTFEGTKFTSDRNAGVVWVDQDGGSLRCYNVDFDNDYYRGAFVIDNSDLAFFQGDYITGRAVIDSTTRVEFYYNVWDQYSSESTYEITGADTDVIFSIKQRWGRIYDNDSTVDSVGYATNFNVSGDNVNLTFRDGICNSWVRSDNSPAHTYGRILWENTWNEYGRPGAAVTTGAGQSSVNVTWEVRNSTLRHTPTPWDATDTGLSGIHHFEANFLSADSANVELYVVNSTLEFGDPAAPQTGARFLGNIFQIGWLGKTVIENSKLLDWGDDDIAGAYRYHGNITPYSSFTMVNSVSEQYGNSEDAWLVSFPSGVFFANAQKPVIAGNIFYFRGVTSGKSILQFNTDTRQPTSQDSLLIAQNTIVGNGLQTLARLTTVASAGGYQAAWDSLNKAMRYTEEVTTGIIKNYGRLYTRGFSHTSQTGSRNSLVNVISSDGILLMGADSLRKNGVDGDSLLVEIYPMFGMAANGQTYPMNKMDVNLTFYAHKAPAVSYSQPVGVYDVRAIAHRRVNASGLLAVDSLSNNKITFTMSGQGMASDFTHFDFVVHNNNTFPVELGIWLKQSLNYSHMVITRF